jgi:BirA family biotin operon repressor/biotin-[acetyl-CoA-carboxylase] ligase
MIEGWSWIESTSSQVTVPVWILAGIQTQGRGRYGREWSSLRGNFLGSWVYRWNMFSIENEISLLSSYIGSLSLFMNLALYRVIYFLTQRVVHTKWPNDILIDEKKIGGILLEYHVSSQKNFVDIVLGVGVNLIQKPDLPISDRIIFPPTSLEEQGVSCNLFVFLELLQKSWIDILESLFSGHEEDLKQEWLQNAYGYQKKICIQKKDSSFAEGIFDSLNSQGELILKNNSDEKTITWGDVLKMNI